MKKSIFHYLPLFVMVFFALPLAGQKLPLIPHTSIISLDDSDFPYNRLKVFVYDTETASHETVNKGNFALYHNNELIHVEEVIKEDKTNGLSIYFLVDNRINVDTKRFIRGRFKLLQSALPGNILVEHREINDFKIHRKRRFFQRKEDLNEHNIESDSPNFPDINSVITGKTDDIDCLYILFLDECIDHTENLLDLVKDYYAVDEDRWFGLFFTKYTEDCREVSHPFLKYDQDAENVLFTRIFNDTTFLRDILKTVNNYQNSIYTLYFKTGHITGLDNIHKFNLEYTSGPFTCTGSINHTFPEDYIKAGFVNYTIKVSDSLKNIGKRQSALDLLYDAYNQVSGTMLRNAALELLKQEVEEMIEKPEYDPFPFFTVSEKNWGFSIQHDPWYKNARIKLLKDYFVKTGRYNNEQKFELLETIYALDPDDEQFNIYYHHALGNNFLAKDDYDAATMAYLEVYDPASSAEGLKKDLLSALRGLFRDKYRKQDYITIYQTGIKMYDLFKHLFEMNYYFGFSCRYMKDFVRAHELYSYMVNNWTDNQNLISWNNLLSSLEELSVNTGKFDDALSMNIRIQRNHGGTEHIEKYLINCRTRDYYPLSQLLASFFTRNGIRHRFDGIDKNYPGEIPPGIRSIYFIDQQSAVLYTSYKQNVVYHPDISHIGNKDELLLRSQAGSDHIAHLIQRVAENQYMVIELINIKSELNKIMLKEIEKDNIQNAPWEALIMSEKQQNFKRTSVFFAMAAASELGSNNNIDINGYYRSVSGTADIEYIVYHNSKGQMEQSAGFVIDRAEYPAGYWERSSMTPAYFEQTITYDGRKVTERSNPLYYDGELIGVIRIGFAHQFK